MMTVTVTTKMLADRLVASYKESLTEFGSEEVHNANCDAWRRFFGDSFYFEAVAICEGLISDGSVQEGGAE